MTLVEQLAAFVVRSPYDKLSLAVRDQLKIRILDSLGCAIGALKGEPIQLIRAHTEDFGGASHCTLIGGGRTAPDRAAFYNSALVRYLDFNDSFLAPGETCHPSDNFGSALAAAEYAGRSGRDLLTALAVAYQVQCRWSSAALPPKFVVHRHRPSSRIPARVAAWAPSSSLPPRCARRLPRAGWGTWCAGTDAINSTVSRPRVTRFVISRSSVRTRLPALFSLNGLT
jgi:2-methylcitrate dehydratase PrpD